MTLFPIFITAHLRAQQPLMVPALSRKKGRKESHWLYMCRARGPGDFSNPVERL